jgi:HSP20 family protein
MNTETSMDKRQEHAATSEPRRTVTPVVDIYENKDEVLLVADLPGVSPDGINIQFQKDELTIEGRRTKLSEGSQLAAEFRYLDFLRTFVVPQGIQADGISAEMAHGVLRVHLPKVAARKPRQIAVKAG